MTKVAQRANRRGQVITHAHTPALSCDHDLLFFWLQGDHCSVPDCDRVQVGWFPTLNPTSSTATAVPAFQHKSVQRKNRPAKGTHVARCMYTGLSTYRVLAILLAQLQEPRHIVFVSVSLHPHSKADTVDGQNPAPSEKLWEIIVSWYLQGNRIIPGFLRWCRNSSIHSTYEKSTKLSCKSKSFSLTLSRLTTEETLRCNAVIHCSDGWDRTAQVSSAAWRPYKDCWWGRTSVCGVLCGSPRLCARRLA